MSTFAIKSRGAVRTAPDLLTAVALYKSIGFNDPSAERSIWHVNRDGNWTLLHKFDGD